MSRDLSGAMVEETTSKRVDLDYILFIKWLLSPVILTFVILPAVILVLIYVSSLVLYIYQVHFSGTSDDR